MKLQDLAVKTAKCVFGIGDDDCPPIIQGEIRKKERNLRAIADARGPAPNPVSAPDTEPEPEPESEREPDSKNVKRNKSGKIFNAKFVSGNKPASSNKPASTSSSSSSGNNSLTSFNKAADQTGSVGLDPLELEKGKGHYFLIFLLLLLGGAFTIGEKEENQ